ncbi:unnamed protein product [Dicrocoelium dendriticum]|nr:unnamed protein product [Dicrocoelium dendriticum]
MYEILVLLPSSPGVFYETISNDVGAQMAFSKASRISETEKTNQPEENAVSEPPVNEVPSTDECTGRKISVAKAIPAKDPAPNDTIQSVTVTQDTAYLQAANFLLEHHAYTVS